MRHSKLIPIVLVLLIFSSGCLVKEPAKVEINADKTAVKEGDIFHIIVKINNTGKVGITGVNLYLNNPEFKILQTPSLHAPLKVGKATELIWIIQAPSKPGRYMIKVSVEVVDELQRTWGGFYKELIINVVEKESEIPLFGVLSTSVTSPEKVEGGNEFRVEITLKNTGNAPITLRRVSLNLLEGMELVKEPDVPTNILPREEHALIYVIKAPYKPEEGYITISTMSVSACRSFEIGSDHDNQTGSRHEILFQASLGQGTPKIARFDRDQTMMVRIVSETPFGNNGVQDQWKGCPCRRCSSQTPMLRRDPLTGPKQLPDLRRTQRCIVELTARSTTRQRRLQTHLALRIRIG